MNEQDQTTTAHPRYGSRYRQAAKAESRLRGRITSALAGISLVAVPVIAYTAFNKPVTDFQPATPISSADVNLVIDDLYAGLNTLETRHQSCEVGTTRLGDQCIDDVSAVGTWSQATGTCNAAGKTLCSAQTLQTCDLVNPATSACTALTDGAAGTTTWTSTSVAMAGENISSRQVAFAGDGTLVVADVTGGGLARNYLCCSTILAP